METYRISRFSRTSTIVAVLASVVAGLVSSDTARATDFLRGDANGDGRVSMADAVFTVQFLFFGQSAPPCLKAADANDDQLINLSDATYTFIFIAAGGAAPLAPFPAPGSDPTEDGLSCNSAGGTGMLDVDTAVLSLDVAPVAGGDSDRAVVTVRVSNSVAVGGLDGEIAVEGSVLSRVIGEPNILVQTAPTAGARATVIPGGHVRFGWIGSLTSSAPLAPGADVAVMSFVVCLSEETEAGSYGLDLVAGELVDNASRRSISTSLLDGVLELAADLADDVGCSPPGEQPERPDQIEARIALADGVANVGGSVEIPYTIENNADTQGFSFSIDFDEDVLEATDVARLYEKPDGTDWGFWSFDINNERASSGSGGVDEGFLVGGAVMSFFDNDNNIPAGEAVEVLGLTFQVRADAPVGVTALRLIDGGQGRGEPISNALTSFGTLVNPSVAKSFILINGVLDIVADVTLFIRGDANADGVVDISDAQATLGYLFLGTVAPFCLDAADANDDGMLNVADPVRTLDWLFRGGAPIPAPSGRPGIDRTEDGLSCGPAV